MAAGLLLPLDVFWDILLCLEVKDLFRFRCVSKFFRSLIDDNPDFIKQHNSLNSNTVGYGIYFFEDDSFQTRIVDLTRSVENNLVVVVPMLNRQPRRRENYCDGLLGSSNGLVVMRSCFTSGLYSSSEITIWNPFNGKFKRVALPSTQGNRRAQGFCYDPNTNDYKFLNIVQSSYNNIVKAFVYSLNSNSWKEIVNGNWSLVSDLFLPYTRDFGVVANNALHWLCFDPICMKIVAFNVVNEEFHSCCVPLPQLMSLESNTHMSVFDGCLSLTYSSRVEIWVWIMKEYNIVEQSWTKLFSCLPSDMEPLQHNYWSVSSLTFSRGRDKVLLYSHARGVYGWYDLVSKKVVPFFCALNVTTFAASLVAFQKNIKWCGQFEEEPFSSFPKKKKRKRTQNTTPSSSASARKKRRRGKGL